MTPGATTATCAYCGNQVLLKHTRHAMPAARVPGPGPRPAPPVKKVSPLVIIIPFLILFAGIGGAVMCVVHQVKKTADNITHQVTSETKKATSAWTGNNSGDTETKTKSRIRWVDYAARTAARVNGDDVHDFVGVAYYPNDNNATYVIAVDGATFEHIWKAGPYGDADVQAMSNTQLEVIGDHVLVTDHKSMARVLERPSGKELRAAALTDRGEWICPHPTDTDRAWIEVSDKNNAWITLSSGELNKQKKHPAHCPEWSDRTECREVGSATCVPNRRGRTFREPRGTNMDAALRDGDDLVAFGYKQPGTNHSMLAGLSSDGKKVEWERMLVDTNDTADVTGEPDFLDLAGGGVYAYYELGRNNHHMIAIDAGTGATRWDIELPGKDNFDPDPAMIVASPTRVFVMAGEVLYVFDPADGTLLGQVGDRW